MVRERQSTSDVTTHRRGVYYPFQGEDTLNSRANVVHHVVRLGHMQTHSALSNDAETEPTPDGFGFSAQGPYRV